MNYTESVIWDQLGQPIYFLKNDWVIDLQGNAVGFIDRTGAVYNSKGFHVAWFEGGVMRDYYGNCLGFCEAVTDTVVPPLPPSRVSPPQLPKKVYPIVHPPASVASPPPHPRYTWSPQNLRDVFR